MNSSDIREPVQKRSIEKKEKIIEAGFELICNKGYHNTNTAEIAKAAGVSTGIVYQYFKDKHNILIEGIKKYSMHIFYPMLYTTENIVITQENIENIIKEMIHKFIENHKLSQVAHEEITAMTHSDNEIANFFAEHEMYMTKKISDTLIKNNFRIENINEKVHIAINIIDNICHEVVYHKHSELDYDAMINIAVKTVANLLK